MSPEMATVFIACIFFHAALTGNDRRIIVAYFLSMLLFGFLIVRVLL